MSIRNSFLQHAIVLCAGFGFIASAEAQLESLVSDEMEAFKASKPFSVVFDDENTLFGVEFGPDNTFFKIEDEWNLIYVAGWPGPEGLPREDGYVGDGESMRNARFKGMHDLAISPDGQTVFIADTFNNRVRVIDRTAEVIDTLVGGSDTGFADGPLETAMINQPFTVTLDDEGKRLLIADLKNLRVREVDLEAETIRTVAGNGKRGRAIEGAVATETPLISPRAAIYGRDGAIYIASREGNAVRRIGDDGTIRTVVNSSGKKGYGGDGGPAIDALLSGPKHLSLDPNGDIVIADDQNHCVRLYRLADQTIHLLAGMPEQAGKKYGNGRLDTQLQRPHGARYDKLGRLWVCDSWNNQLIRFDK
jgi:DNA-binding beta-propeller fold protein YncE